MPPPRSTIADAGVGVTKARPMKKNAKSVAGSAEACFKRSDGQVKVVAWNDLDPNAVAEGRPWRTFPWYLGQKNYSGLYWCATESRLVGYESRLELTRLVMADFDVAAKRIVSQPFRLTATIGEERIRRVPDYLVITEAGVFVIDVTRASKLERPEFAGVLEQTRQIVESRGWIYEIASEPARVEYSNIRFLAGYRRPWLFKPEVLAEVRQVAQTVPELTIGEISSRTTLPRPTALPALMHLLWRQEVRVDLTHRLSPHMVVRTMA